MSLIKNPGGEVAVWSVLWASAGAFLSYLCFSEGNLPMAVACGLLAIASVCLWLGIRQAKWVLIGYMTLAICGGVMILSTRGFDFRAIVQMLGAVYFSFLLVRWPGGPRS